MLAEDLSPASPAATKLQMYGDLHRDAATAGRDAGERLEAMMKGADVAEEAAALTGRRPPRYAAPGAVPDEGERTSP